MGLQEWAFLGFSLSEDLFDKRSWFWLIALYLIESALMEERRTRSDWKRDNWKHCLVRRLPNLQCRIGYALLAWKRQDFGSHPKNPIRRYKELPPMEQKIEDSRNERCEGPCIDGICFEDLKCNAVCA